MNYQKYLVLIATAASLAGIGQQAFAMNIEDSLGNNKSQTTANDGLEDKPVQPYDQMLTLEAGPYKPKSINFTNWNNNSFNYDDTALSSFTAQLGWAMSVVKTDHFMFSLSESLDYSNFNYALPATMAANPGNVSVSMHMFSFDTRIQQSWTSSPILSIIPFWEAGYMISLWNQNGVDDLTAGEGTAGNFVAGLGVRYWINRSASLNHEFPNRYSALPVFITAKVNQIFSNNGGVDPADTTVVGGLSIGL